MKPGIQSRLFLALLGSIALVVAAMAFAVNWSFQRGLEDYLRQVELERLDRVVDALSRAYGEHGDWEFLRHNARLWYRLTETGSSARDAGTPGQHRPPPPHRPPGRGHPPAGQHPRPPFPGGFSTAPGQGPPRGPGIAPGAAPPAPDPFGLRPRLRLFDVDGERVFGPPTVDGEELRRPVAWQGDTVGYLALRTHGMDTDDLALGFQASQRRTYGLIAAFAVALSALASLLLARRMLRPVRRITAAARSLGAGRYHTRIPEDRSDELGDLARDFNRLADTLERNEQSRRQWVADISHELRTPLAVLRGEIEALLDGVRENSPQRMSSLHGEVLGLGKLVDDLYELALSDLGALNYRREPLDLAELVADTLDAFQPRFAARDLRLVNKIATPLPMLGDPRRLRQLFANLLENSLRYTDGGGQLEIGLETPGDGHRLLLQDTAPAAPAQALTHLFERLYRVDKSRSRAQGGAGLGLTICRNIVEAHGGRIEAGHSPLGGLALHIHLPAEGTDK